MTTTLDPNIRRWIEDRIAMHAADAKNEELSKSTRDTAWQLARELRAVLTGKFHIRGGGEIDIS